MKKLLMNNVKKIIATCPCCGSVEDECICTTLEELGASELELDFAISGKYANITYISSSSTYSYNSKTWQAITNSIKLSVLTSFNTKMAELGRVNATNNGTDYYGRYISSSNCVIYWNRTDYGTPNITLLNKLLAFTDEQLGHLKTYGKCVVPCGFCGETHKEDNCPYINTYVFDVKSATSYSSSYNRKITFPSSALRGDTTSTVLTDWGDGTRDTSLNHTYSSDGVYIVKTKHCLSTSGSPSSTSNIRQYLQEVKSLNKNITSLNDMFNSCSLAFTTFDITNFDASNVTTMEKMFYYCPLLTTINMSNWNTSNVTTMKNMFYRCEGLTSLNVSGWDTSEVTDMYGMFQQCGLTSLDLSSWDMSNVTNVNYMFKDYKALTDFKAPQNISISIDFSPCTNLTHDSLMSIINNLATVSSKKTLTLGSTNKAKLTNEEIAIATAKNWSVG